MIISAAFRDVNKQYFINGPYAFECEFDVKVGDIILVDTKYGLSLAQVHKLNAEVPEHVQRLYGELAKVREVCKTEYPLPEVK